MIEQTRRPTHPGEILKEMYLVPLNIGITEFADCIGISRKTVSAIINGHRRITPDMAVRFAMALPNTNADMWLNLQKACDLFDARRELAHIAITPVASAARASRAALA